MASALYERIKEKFLNGDIDWINDDIKVILIDVDAYTVQVSTHEFLADIPAAARVAISTNLTGKTSTTGVADADGITIFGVAISRQFEALVIFKDSGTEATSPLIAFIDNTVLTTSIGDDVEIIWDSGNNRIFRL